MNRRIGAARAPCAAGVHACVWLFHECGSEDHGGTREMREVRDVLVGGVPVRPHAEGKAGRCAQSALVALYGVR
eukprot:7080819-Prymnesium_polylepis.1